MSVTCTYCMNKPPIEEAHLYYRIDRKSGQVSCPHLLCFFCFKKHEPEFTQFPGTDIVTISIFQAEFICLLTLCRRIEPWYRNKLGWILSSYYPESVWHELKLVLKPDKSNIEEGMYLGPV